jgi:uncharacterized protein YceK
MVCARWLVLAVVTMLAGCATLGPRTSGADGPIEWQAADLELDRKDQSSPWVYSFTLELRDTQGRRVTFTEMTRQLYQPGTGSASGTSRGTWTIPARGVLRIPMWSSLRCGSGEATCSGTLMPIPLWKITLTGADDNAHPVRAVIDLRLPADPPSGPAQIPSPTPFATAAPRPPASPATAPARPAPLVTASAPVSVPIQIIENIILVPVTLNRSHGATFLLDTGAQFTVLTPELAGRIGLVVPADAPTKAVPVVGGQHITIPFVRLPLIELGSGRVEDVEVGVYEVAPESPLIDGLLGVDILGRFTMTVDRAARQLRLDPVAR